MIPTWGWYHVEYNVGLHCWKTGHLAGAADRSTLGCKSMSISLCMTPMPAAIITCHGPMGDGSSGYRGGLVIT